MENITLNSQSFYDYLLKKYAAGSITISVGRDYRNYVERLKNNLNVRKVITLTANNSYVFEHIVSSGVVGDAYVFRISGNSGTATIRYTAPDGQYAVKNVNTGNSIVCIDVVEDNGETIQKWITIVDDSVEIEVTNAGSTFAWGATVNIGSVQGHNLTLTAPGDPALNTVGQVTFDGINVLENGTSINNSAKKKLRLPVVYMQTTGNNKGLRMKYWTSAGVESSITVAALADFIALLGNPVLTSAQTLTSAEKEQVLTNLGIAELIPTQASSSNQLADKAFVNSSIATNTATFRGTYRLYDDLGVTVTGQSYDKTTCSSHLKTTVSGTDNNDYCFILVPIANEQGSPTQYIDRYKYDGTAWSYEYTLNNSGFTAAQWAAIQSGITSTLVTKLSALPTNNDLTTSFGQKADKVSSPTAGHIAGLNSSGNLTDSGIAANDVVQSKQVENKGTKVNNVITLTNAEYIALTSTDANTIYNII